MHPEGRRDLPKEVVFTPVGLVPSAAACSVVTIVKADQSTAVWTLKGGTALRQRRGFAGPDLTATGAELAKLVRGCDSDAAVVSGEAAAPWGSVHNLAGALVQADDKGKLRRIVVLPPAPTPGRPVELSTPVGRR